MTSMANKIWLIDTESMKACLDLHLLILVPIRSYCESRFTRARTNASRIWEDMVKYNRNGLLVGRLFWLAADVLQSNDHHLYDIIERLKMWV